ncbi:MAG: hypothetical protein R6U96_18510 [Promethearchaeia archaeon]
MTNKQLAEEFHLPHQSVVKLTSRGTDAGLLKKTPPEDLKLGGPKYYFRLTEVGETQLRRLYADLRAIFGDEEKTSAHPEAKEGTVIIILSKSEFSLFPSSNQLLISLSSVGYVILFVRFIRFL